MHWHMEVASISIEVLSVALHVLTLIWEFMT